jgi:regulator of extracellular matrix RemA (YlzA/DUF370 family)
MKFVNLGFNNLVIATRIVAVVSPDASPSRRLRATAQKLNKLVNATNGRRARAIIVTDSDHVVLSALQPETLAERIAGA